MSDNDPPEWLDSFADDGKGVIIIIIIMINISNAIQTFCTLYSKVL